MQHQQTKSIQTDRLVLRAIENSDIQNIFKGLSNAQAIQHYGVSFDTLEATKEQMQWYAKPQQCWWVICDRETEQFYGAGGLNDIATTHKKAEIGLWLLPQFWGNGIMKEAMPLICIYGFEQLGLHRIEGFVDADNQNCKNAMAKLDFEHEGTMRDCEIKDGNYISVDIYAKLNR